MPSSLIGLSRAQMGSALRELQSGGHASGEGQSLKLPRGSFMVSLVPRPITEAAHAVHVWQASY
jgi:hypothetical protein